MRSVTRRLALPALVGVAALALAGAPGGSSPASGGVAQSPRAAGRPALRVLPASTGRVLHRGLATPPTTSDCQSRLQLNCYSPLQYQHAYDLAPLFARGITGTGRTIAIVDSFGSPTIAHDLHVFDQAYGLADPPSLRIIAPAGAIPRFNPNNPDHTGWAGETTLDVEYAHAMAPEANILLVETPVSESEGVTGFPEIVKAENYVIDHNLADVISQSFGATEQTFPSASSLLGLRSAFINADRHHVTVLAASGDSGATDYQLDGSSLYSRRVDSWPSSDPLVTSIGGTRLALDATGNRAAPDMVWNDGFGAAGGGLSSVFSRPAFQRGVAAVVGTHRGTPDISMSAAVNGAAITYSSYDPADTGWSLVGGTSEATPIFAGVVALADQLAHRRLGVINQALYTIGQRRWSGIVDVTTGTNSYNGVTGYSAGPGYDLASGWGTVDVAEFVPQLAFTATHAVWR